MMEILSTQFVARYRKLDGTPQSVDEHLLGVADLASVFAGKIGLSVFGELMGALHDLGKYSKSFQSYIKSAEGRIKPDDEEYVVADEMRGKIDHSSAGAQYIFKHRGQVPIRQIASDIMALCIASHHSRSGVIDSLSPDGTDLFHKRMMKPKEQTHLDEVEQLLDEHVRLIVEKCIASNELESQLSARIKLLWGSGDSLEVRQFLLGFLTRFLFSTLIDADRLNSAERLPRSKQSWPLLINVFEANLAGFKIEKPIDKIRDDISLSCLRFASRQRGLYQLTVPTGGGKTLASLRFALHHADTYKMDRIIYVVPYTSIIDQNARVARSI
ncbi:MAG: CRISPR-associated endonuclease Cas3'', partial [Desulfobulbaceae bacterium]|nr:CRISPR-associated endonuclease Cas3'' [Desulfobulbaceae bacterium]